MRDPALSPVEQWLLAALACVAIAAFGASYDQAIAWTLWAPCLASALWTIARVPAWLQTSVQYLAWALFASALILGLIFMAFPILLSPQLSARLTLFIGYALAVFGVLFALGTPVWRPASALIPCALALLAVACFNLIAAIRGLIGAAGYILFAYLAVLTVQGPWRELLRVRVLTRYGLPALASASVAAAIMWLLPLAQAGVEQVTFKLFLSTGKQYAGFSNESRLGDIEKLKLSTAVVMRVWTDYPQHLRGRVFTRFDGRTWSARPSPGTALGPTITMATVPRETAAWMERIAGSDFVLPGKNPAEASGPNWARTRIVQAVFNNGMMVSPRQKLLVRAPLGQLRVDEWENLTPPLSSAVEIYGVVSHRSGEVVQPGPASAETVAEALALPDGVDPRLTALAARLGEGAPSPKERVRRTVNHVENECRYSLDVGKFHSEQPVAEFLFEKKKGYCQYFASAAAVLLRLQGVPTRYVHGFSVGEGNRLGGHYVVRELDAHAWIETYLPNQGWVEVDPTPAAEYEALHRDLRGGPISSAMEWLRAGLAEFFVYVRQADWRGMLRWTWVQTKALLRLLFTTWAGLTLLLAAALAWLRSWLRRWKKARTARAAKPAVAVSLAEPSPELASLLAQLDVALAARGFPRPAARAPLEHLQGVPPGKVPAELARAGRNIVESYYRASFGGVKPETVAIAQLRGSLDQVAVRKA